LFKIKNKKCSNKLTFSKNSIKRRNIKEKKILGKQKKETKPEKIQLSQINRKRNGKPHLRSSTPSVYKRCLNFIKI
jgi:hypothetical protein